ncbi:MAG: hypothetical protein QOH21_3128 [Acidobacteriota bacterium]|nr:hypothetical protein [Acidobacteriota bacterium]
MNRCIRRTFTALGAVVFLLFAAPSFAQIQSGSIYGRVTAGDGAVLPGVTVTLTGVGAPQVTVTDTQGNFRFPNLSPARYDLKADLAGYGSAGRSEVAVGIGQNAEVSFALNPALKETITVVGASLLDERRIATGTSVSQRELDQVPTVRDPWGLLQQTPGVLMDRNNIGGSESGSQPQFVSKGATNAEATYTVDGINTTDMVAGNSATYYDFGAFEEVQITTGGTDPRIQTPGAQVNVVTKRGTNDFAGSLRYVATPGSTQGERKIPAEARSYIHNTNEVDFVSEWGVETGGPLIKDRLWLWGAFANNDIELLKAQGFTDSARFSDRLSLRTYNAKLNAQLAEDNTLTLFWFDNEKVNTGRGQSLSTPIESTLNQSNYGPSGTYKVEDTHIFSPNFYLTGLYSHVNEGFQLMPHSGADCRDLDCVLQNATKPMVFSGATSQYRNTFVASRTQRPQDTYRADGASFFTTATANHELKFGFGYRAAGAEGLTLYPQNQFIYDQTGINDDIPDGFGVAYFYAISPYSYEFSYTDAYVGDTIAWKNFTFQAGLRYDRQVTRAGDQLSPANDAVPDYLPAINYPKSEIPAYDWSSIVPRLGVTYALGAEKKTLVRAAYNRYVGQLGGNSSGYSLAVPGYRYVAFYVLDADRNDIISKDEVLYDYGVYTFSGFDINDPQSTLQPARIDPGATQPSTNEYLAGVERELLRDFVVGVNYTHRDFSDFLWQRPEKTPGAGDWYTSADYVVASTLTPPPGVTEAGNYSIPVYRLKPGIPVASHYVLTNRDGYSQTYDGVELTFTKRMSRRWSLRGHGTWNDWRKQVSPEAIIDPTPLRNTSGCSTCDDSRVVLGSTAIGGQRGGVYVSSRWQTNVAGLYQIPRIETTVGFNFSLREGYPILYTHQFNLLNGEGSKQVLVNDIGASKLPNPYALDLRIARELRFHGVGIELGIDAFNVTNNQTILQRNTPLVARNLPVPSRNQIRELQNPRVLRFGAKMTF